MVTLPCGYALEGKRLSPGTKRAMEQVKHRQVIARRQNWLRARSKRPLRLHGGLVMCCQQCLPRLGGVKM
eukprot:10325852-Prorocentrum_lima.AAC.1